MSQKEQDSTVITSPETTVSSVILEHRRTWEVWPRMGFLPLNTSDVGTGWFLVVGPSWAPSGADSLPGLPPRGTSVTPPLTRAHVARTHRPPSPAGARSPGENLCPRGWPAWSHLAQGSRLLQTRASPQTSHGDGDESASPSCGGARRCRVAKPLLRSWKLPNPGFSHRVNHPWTPEGSPPYPRPFPASPRTSAGYLPRDPGFLALRQKQ